MENHQVLTIEVQHKIDLKETHEPHLHPPHSEQDQMEQTREGKDGQIAQNGFYRTWTYRMGP